MTIHHDFKKGKKVHVILNDGTVIVDKFAGGPKSRCLSLEHYDIPYKKIRSATIYKEK